MVAILGYSREEIAAAVREMYTAVAADPKGPFHFPVGRAGLEAVGYPPDLLDGLPEAALEAFAGVGCPFRAGTPAPGERVLDVGAGAGVDTLVAARCVGPGGRVFALDTTPAMTSRLRRTAAAAGADHVEVLDGGAEAVPLPDASVDVVISNGVINLVPGKRRALRELFRVLRPGGRMQIADIVIRRPVTPDCTGDPKLWAECVVGATVEEDYLDLFRDAGFAEVEIVGRHDYFRHSPSQETQEVARSFGASAVELKMQRAAEAPAWLATALRRADPRRAARRIARYGLSGVVLLGLALAACYGTVAAMAALALAGATVGLHEGAWAGAVAGLAAASAAVTTAGWRKHRRPLPSALAVAGAMLLGYAMIVAYHPAVEALGFTLLAGGVLWDYRVRRYLDSPRRGTAAAKGARWTARGHTNHSKGRTA